MKTDTRTKNNLTPTDEIASAQRRGQRIAAMNAGQKIPFPETAEQDHSARGNPDDAAVLAMLKGEAEIAGGTLFPPAQLLRPGATARNAKSAVNETTMANEAPMFAIGCFISGKGNYYA